MTRIALLAVTALLTVGCVHGLSSQRDILFVTQRPGGTEDVHALRLADLTTSPLVKGDSVSSRSLPARSPDGRSIAFVRERGGSSELYVMDNLGATPRRVAGELESFLAWPDWSPDGATLLFTAGTTHAPDVYVIRANGSGLRRVLHDTAADYRCPSWSPDGQQFTVSAFRAGRSSILTIELESGRIRTLVASDTSYLDCPQWSPKGDAIAFTIDPRPGDIWTADPMRPWRSDLVIFDLRRGQLRPLVGGYGLNNYGRWSRDGRWIVFQSNRHAVPHIDTLPLRDRFRSLEIYAMRSDGSDLRRLTTNTYFDAHPSW